MITTPLLRNVRAEMKHATSNTVRSTRTIKKLKTNPRWASFGYILYSRMERNLLPKCISIASFYHRYGKHYSDVIMSAMASQITSVTIVYITVHSGADKKKNKSSASRAFVRGIHRWPVNSPHKRPVTRKMFPFDDGIMTQCHSCTALQYTDLVHDRRPQAFCDITITLQWALKWFVNDTVYQDQLIVV